MHEAEEIFICSCHLPEHQFILSYDECDEDIPVMYLTVHMVPDPSVWNRIKTAVRHVFGYRTKYGEFDEVVIEPADARRMADLVRGFLFGPALRSFDAVQYRNENRRWFRE